MLQIRAQKLELVGVALGVLIVMLSIIGAVRAYSPIPTGDMWDGYIDFYIKATSGDVSSWWAQHNEHRLLLTRLFFWMDLGIFKGSVVFLIAVSFIFIGINSAIFISAWNELYAKKSVLPRFLIVAWLFAWSQEENLTWGFQSQFILAVLLPLAGLFFCYKSTCGDKPGFYFSLATMCGMLAIGSMANGILALPILTLFSVFVRVGWKKNLFLMVLSAISIWVYFSGYASPNYHGSFIETLISDPLGLVQYALLYIGSPFYYLAGKNSFGIVLAKFVGLVFLFATVSLTLRSFKRVDQGRLQIALLFLYYSLSLLPLEPLVGG